jgi:hypothetical protein
MVRIHRVPVKKIGGCAGDRLVTDRLLVFEEDLRVGGWPDTAGATRVLGTCGDHVKRAVDPIMQASDQINEACIQREDWSKREFHKRHEVILRSYSSFQRLHSLYRGRDQLTPLSTLIEKKAVSARQILLICTIRNGQD